MKLSKIIPQNGSDMSQDKKLMRLAHDHIIFLYVCESLFFTRWPYVAAEPLYSSTNMMLPLALVGISCLGVAHASTMMYGCDKVGQKMWQCTTVARKISAILYFSNLGTVACLGLTYAAYSLVRSIFGRRVQGKTCTTESLVFIQGVFTAYVLTVALMNQGLVYVIVFAFNSWFLRSYPQIQYCFEHIYCLCVFTIVV